MSQRLLNIVCSLLVASSVAAQNTAATDSAVPGSTSPPQALDDYDSPYRPQIHFSPPEGFMNDPNGLFIDSQGTYHLYYQFNPTELQAGNQHWGHATSRDLYQWTNQKNALAPTDGSDPGLIFSGSAVRDPNNTSGVFPSGDGSSNVLAFYTVASNMLQTQDVAYSTDNGYTFTKYLGNPVIDYNDPDFRDPKVFWHAPTEKWVMAVAFSVEHVISFFTSSDAKNWTLASNFSNAGILGVLYECPNLVEVPLLKDAYAEDKFSSDNIDGTAWLLLISINPGAPLGGSISQYFPGTFNGTHFEAYDEATRLTDWAKDNYAAQFWDGIPSNQGQVMIPWASNWQYTNDVPTSIAGFRGVFGVPRITGLAHTFRSNWTLVSTPYKFPSELYTSISSDASLSSGNNSAPTSSNVSFTNSTRYIDISTASALPSGAFTMTIKVDSLSNATTGGTINFTLLATGTSESLRGGYILGTSSNGYSGTIWLDRSGMKGYSSPLFTGQFSNSYLQDPSRSMFEILIVVDRGIIEIFTDAGIGPSGTIVWFQSEEAVSGGGVDLLVLSSAVDGDGAVNAEIRGLKSGWR